MYCADVEWHCTLQSSRLYAAYFIQLVLDYLVMLYQQCNIELGEQMIIYGKSEMFVKWVQPLSGIQISITTVQVRCVPAGMTCSV
jgi:hypothetical protein